MIIPNIWKNESHVPVTTNQYPLVLTINPPKTWAKISADLSSTPRGPAGFSSWAVAILKPLPTGVPALLAGEAEASHVAMLKNGGSTGGNG